MKLKPITDQEILKKFVGLQEGDQIFFSRHPNPVAHKIGQSFGGNYLVLKKGQKKPQKINGYRKFNCPSGPGREHCNSGNCGCPCIDPRLEKLPKKAPFGAVNGVLYIP